MTAAKVPRLRCLARRLFTTQAHVEADNWQTACAMISRDRAWAQYEIPVNTERNHIAKSQSP